MRDMSAIRGVVAAITTPVTDKRTPDLRRFLWLARHLLDHGCDALNVLGTTGEATSFSLAQRGKVMRAAAEELDRTRLMAGTGAASLADAIALTRLAATLGLAGALVLPPFYYKGVSDDGIVAFVAAIVAATEAEPVPLYLYNFPAFSGVPFTHALVAKLVGRFPLRIRGLKDSSGDLPYARALADTYPGFAVFPSNEAALMEARQGRFAGCISATCNLNADYCARAWHDGDIKALETAVAIRRLFDGKPLVAGVKAGLAHVHGDEALATPLPPLVAWDPAARAALGRDLDRLRGFAATPGKIGSFQR